MLNAQAKPIPAGAFLAAGEFDLSEETLARRFGAPAKNPKPAVYEVTSDLGYLHQYFLLRDDARAQNAFDAGSEIIVARIGNHVVGGCRITFSTAAERKPLPMEQGGFALSARFPELSLPQVPHAEISAIAVLPGFENGVVMLELSRLVLKRLAAKKARFAFALTSQTQARHCRNAMQLFGLNWMVCDHAAVSGLENDGGMRALSMLELSPLYHSKPKSRAKAKDSAQLMSA